MICQTIYRIFSHKRLGVYCFKHELDPAFKGDPALIGDPAFIISYLKCSQQQKQILN